MARLLILLLTVAVSSIGAQEPPPEIRRPVNDFANVVDSSSEAALESLIRSLEAASGDVVVVATVDTFAPYGSLGEYAVEMFENRGRGIGRKGKDNGVLVVLAVADREVRVEVGYDLEQFITDGFAGETSRQYMAPEFRRGRYGTGLLAGVSRIASRIAEARNVTLQGARRSRARDDESDDAPGGGFFLMLFVAIVLLQILGRVLGFGGRRRFRRRWGGYHGGWHSGVGPFGTSGFGGLGGGGFGGGFGGFGGGRSGGGGGGASW